MNTSLILSHINGYLPLSPEEETLFISKMAFRHIKRRQHLLQEGDVCRHYTFVVNGCLRLYKTDEKGVEHNLQFATEGWWIADIGSFHSEIPSELNIEALEKSEIIQIKKSSLIDLYDQNLKFDRFFRVLIENAYVALQKRLLQNISSTAEERYLDFRKKYPALLNRIPQTQIASYIGITPEFLSKLKKNL